MKDHLFPPSDQMYLLVMARSHKILLAAREEWKVEFAARKRLIETLMDGESTDTPSPEYAPDMEST